MGNLPSVCLAQLLGTKSGKLPWEGVIEKIHRRLAGWKYKSLSKPGKTNPECHGQHACVLPLFIQGAGWCGLKN